MTAFAFATSSSAMLCVVHDGLHPAMLISQFFKIAWPCSECRTSGWNCTPASFPDASSNAAIGVSEVDAVTLKPHGTSETASPCDIQTDCAAGRPANILEPAFTARGVRPNSDLPVCATTPASAAAIV